MDQITNFFGGNTADREGLHGLFVNELKGMYYAENQLVDALQEQADAATSDEVRNAFLQHKQESRVQAERLEQIFNRLGIEADEMECDAADGLIDDAERVVATTESGSLTRDAGLIIAGQKVEHHEIAAYGSLHTLARVLGYNDVAQILQQSLEEEKATDKKLTMLAESFVNEQAASEGDGTYADRDGDYAGTTSMGSGSSSYSGTMGSSGSERGSNYGSGMGSGAYDTGSSGSGYSRGTMGTDTPGGGFSGGTSTGGDGSRGI